MPDTRDLLAELEEIARKHFGTNVEKFLEAVLSSPNARGYILGSLSELLLGQHVAGLGYEVIRIKEKWTGEKLHHGDFYVRSPGSEDWYILESKGLKSNSERWHKIDQVPPGEAALWFGRKRKGEFRQWWDRLSAERQEAIRECSDFHKSKIIETHFVSGTAGRAGRKMATPRKAEFHIVALDLFLRTGQHEFIFAASEQLESSDKYSDHLKQNYLIDILVPGVADKPEPLPPWSFDFKAVFDQLGEPLTGERQPDLRQPGFREGEEAWALEDDKLDVTEG